MIWITPRTLDDVGEYKDGLPTMGIDRLASYTKILYVALFRRMPVIDTPTLITGTAFSVQAQASTYRDQLDTPEYTTTASPKQR